MQIIKTSITRPPRILFYGEQGMGKSTLAKEAGCIFIQTSDGLEGLGVDTFGMCETLEDVRKQLEFLLKEKHPYKAFCIDTLGGLERLLFSEICSELGLQYMTQASVKSYPLAGKRMHELMDLISKVNAERKMFALLIGHSAITKFEDPTTSSYDRYSLNMNDKLGSYLMQEVDVVGFINQKVLIKEESAGFKGEITKAKGLSRYVFFEKSPAFYAKDHDYGLPSEIKLEKGKMWSAIYDCIKAKISEQKKGNLSATKEKHEAMKAAKITKVEDELPASFNN